MDLKQTYNKIAVDWFKEHAVHDWWIEPAHKFLSYLKPGDKILDLGCGAGLKSKYLIEQGFQAIGVDFSEEMIKLSKVHCPEAQFYVKDIKEPLDLGMFDGIFAQQIFLHIPKAEMTQVLQNVSKSLKTAGFLYLTVKEIRPGQKEEQVMVEHDYNYEYERFFSFFSMPEMKKYLTDLGMTIVYGTVITASGTNWVTIIAQK